MKRHLTALSSMMLPLRVADDTIVNLPLRQVRYIDYPSTVTPLPLTPDYIEGLANFDSRPLIQIDLARLLGLEATTPRQGRIVVVDLPGGALALRVAEVLDFTSGEEAAPLILQELMPWLDKASLETSKEKAESVSSGKIGMLLIVRSGDLRVALRAEEIERITEDFQLLQPSLNSSANAGASRYLLLKQAERLLLATSLAQRSKVAITERYALLPLAIDPASSALLVEQVLRLESINTIQAICDPSGTSSSWHLGPEGDSIEILSLRADASVNEPSGRTRSQLQREQLLQSARRSEGVRISCGQLSCVLPPELAVRALDEAELKANSVLPTVNGSALFWGAVAPDSHYNIQLSLNGCDPVILSVDRAVLYTASALNRWVPLGLLPPPLSQLFEAASYEEGQWVLRATADWGSFIGESVR